MSTPHLYEFFLTNEGRINPDAINALRNTQNVIVVIICGQNRQGKSTTMNIIITKTAGSYTVNYRAPFQEGGGSDAVTQGGYLYGPISLRRLVTQHNLEIECQQDYNIFFVDTEGTRALKHTDNSMNILLTLLNISSVTIHLTNKTPGDDQIKEIISSIGWQSFLKSSLSSQGININLPKSKHIVFCTNIYKEVHTLNEGNLVYNQEAIHVKEIINNYINGNNIQGLNEVDIDCVVGSEFVRNSRNNVNTLSYKLFIKTISQLVKSFSDKILSTTRNMDGDYIANMIPIIFNTFSTIDFNSRTFSLQLFNEYATNNLESHLNETVERISTRLTGNFIQNVDECRNIINQENLASNMLIESISSEMVHVYQITVSNFDTLINNYAENLRRNIIQHGNSAILTFETTILSENYTDNYIHDAINELRGLHYVEEIPQHYIDNSFAQQKWNDMVNENRSIISFIEDQNEEYLATINRNFIQRIQRKLDSAMPIERNDIAREECFQMCSQKIRNYITNKYNTSKDWSDFENTIISNDEIINTQCNEYIDEFNLDVNNLRSLRIRLNQEVDRIRDEFRARYERKKDKIKEYYLKCWFYTMIGFAATRR